MTENRIGALENRMDNLGETVNRVDSKLDGIAATLSSLARIEERQMNTNEKIAVAANQSADHESRIRRLEESMPKDADDRLIDIEKVMPGLIESRKWVVLGILTGLGMMGAALVKLVLIAT